MTIGERIKNRREELEMSQEDLAHKLGYKSRSSVNKIELNVQNLTQSKIKAIADALDTTPAFIMGWEDKKTEPTDGELSEKDRTLINMMHSLDDSHQAELLKFVEAYISVQSQDKN